MESFFKILFYWLTFSGLISLADVCAVNSILFQKIHNMKHSDCCDMSNKIKISYKSAPQKTKQLNLIHSSYLLKVCVSKLFYGWNAEDESVGSVWDRDQT